MSRTVAVSLFAFLTMFATFARTASADEPEQGAELIPEAFRVARKAGSPASPEASGTSEKVTDEANVPVDPLRVSPSHARPALSPEMIALRNKVRQTLDVYYNRRLNTRDHGPWEVMHSVVAFGVDAMVEDGGPGGKPITAIGWLCFNRPARGLTLFTPRGDSFVTRQGPGMQGHEGQLLAILAQAKLRSEYPLHIGERDFSVQDLIDYEKKTCRPHAEHTFKLIGLSHYLESDATWKNDLGQTWSIERMLREELAQPVRGAACGGTHRLYGIAYAVQRRQKQQLPIDRTFAKAEKYIRDYQRYTLSLQNRDGSFSTRWFEGRGDSGDVDRKIKTTGHMLEFMLYTLDDKQIDDPRLARSARLLCDIMLGDRSRKWENGPLGHAVHALSLYSQRRFGEKPVRSPSEVGSPALAGSL